MRTTTINVSELKNYFALIKVEQEFKVLLQQYKEHQEHALKKLEQVKNCADRFKALKKLYSLKKIEIEPETIKELKKYARF